MKCLKIWGAPGTGKTTRLIEEINKLLEAGYRRDDFLVTTFRKAMADELKTRLDWDKEGTVSTLHGACRKFAGINNEVVKDKRRAEFCELKKMAFKKNDKGSEEEALQEKDLGHLFFAATEFLVNNILSFEQITGFHDFRLLREIVPHPQEFMKTYLKEYQEWKAEKELVDYFDMLTTVYRGEVMPNCKVLVVDEFQDLTPLQYNIILMWEKEMEHVLIAGDPRQSVYGFWGASPKFFTEHEGQEIRLKKSYRLPAVIWDYATRILDREMLDYPQIETTDKPGALNKITELAYRQRLKAPEFRENTWHLVRTKRKGRVVAEMLSRAGVPFQASPGIPGWGSSQINFYNAIIKVRKALKGEEVFFTAKELEEILNAYSKHEFQHTKTSLRKQLTKNKALTFKEIKNWVQTDINREQPLWKQIGGDAVLDNTLGGYSDLDNLKHIKISRALKEHGRLIGIPTVVVSTIHGSKGREGENIFLHNSTTRKIWNLLYEARDKTTRESEANLYYVGTTRTMRSLFIVGSGGMYRYRLPDIDGRDNI